MQNIKTLMQPLPPSQYQSKIIKYSEKKLALIVKTQFSTPDEPSSLSAISSISNKQSEKTIICSIEGRNINNNNVSNNAVGTKNSNNSNKTVQMNLDSPLSLPLRAHAPKTPSKRIECDNWFIQPELLTHAYQLSVIKNAYSSAYFNEYFEKYLLIKQQIEHKIYGYKQQDIKKTMHDPETFVTFQYVLELLNNSSLSCVYCDKHVFVLYENVREPSQWTLDRINNNFGHNCGNLLIACLSCNLKRRRTNMDAFLFTKQMKLIKTNANTNANT